MTTINGHLKVKRVYLFLSRSSVKHVKNFNISFNIVLLHNLWNSKLCQRNKSCKIRKQPKIRSDQISNERKF